MNPVAHLRRLEHFLFHGLAALLESPRPTLIDLARIERSRSAAPPFGFDPRRTAHSFAAVNS